MIIKNNITIIIPKKKIKKSVKRNKIKRRILNSFQKNKAFLYKINNYFIIIFYFYNQVLKFNILNKYIKNILIHINYEKKINNRTRKSNRKI
ncbi:MAG: ribonuclease P protein component [Candidatus Shikimatogenerans bostrichidophilus]|nr:MAG: ribonuclease P protein component [Candidatus Shikimatogenerans bostrichidophilus]